ncbi:MAG: trypsin-like serine protease [Bacteriovoracaceae bacterium]|nr:trypsin-like serine protease [Bacteriovoracaceae bacterium]
MKAAVLLISALISFSSFSITLGHKIEYNEAPAVGQLLIGNGTCTATVISERAILTASHCYDDSVRTAKITGSSHLSLFFLPAVREFYRVVHVYRNVDHTADMAIAILDREVPGNIKPLKIYAKKFAPTESTEIKIMGFGYNGEIEYPGIASDQLNTIVNLTLGFESWDQFKMLEMARLEFFEMSEPSPITGKREIILSSLDGSHPCAGDSGAALLVENAGELQIVGVQSRINFDRIMTEKEEVCLGGVQTVGMSIYENLDWIKKIIHQSK